MQSSSQIIKKLNKNTAGFFKMASMASLLLANTIHSQNSTTLIKPEQNNQHDVGTSIGIIAGVIATGLLAVYCLVRRLSDEPILPCRSIKIHIETPENPPPGTSPPLTSQSLENKLEEKPSTPDGLSLTSLLTPKWPSVKSP